MKNLKNALNAYALRKGLTKMNFIKYKGTNEKAALIKNKRKGSKALKANTQKVGGVKKNTRYTRQFVVNLTKAMSTVKALLKINKKNKVGKVLKGRG